MDNKQTLPQGANTDDRGGFSCAGLVGNVYNILDREAKSISY